MFNCKYKGIKRQINVCKFELNMTIDNKMVTSQNFMKKRKKIDSDQLKVNLVADHFDDFFKTN